MARRLRVSVLIAIIAAARAAAAEVSLDLSSATVAHPGDRGRLCVSLATGGADVAGTQNDLVWDGRCATLPDEGACAVAGTHGKELRSRIQSSDDFRLRALILSLSDVDPIADGLLYCCDFAVQAAPGACCPVAIDDAVASDSRGNQVDVIASAGALCVAGAGGASPTPTATPLPLANDDDGCQIASPRPGAAAPWFLALALLLLRRRR
jgi:uncharacterized protein (TIGR03382 family)